MNITKNAIRIGSFTSSKISNLTKVGKDRKSFGAPALTYIEETNMERKLGRCLTDESRAKPLVWGKLMEAVAFSKLPFDYDLNSQDTLQHSLYDFWSGTPDGTAEGKVVFDIKCPITLKSFCQLVDPIIASEKSIINSHAEGITDAIIDDPLHYGMIAMNAIRENHSSGDQYYWQLVSNAILTGLDQAELIIHMPFESELETIRSLAIERDDCNWMLYDELPYLIDGGYYNNLYTVRFNVPQADKDHLTDCVVRAGAMLIN